MITFLIGFPIAAIWIFIASYYDVSFPAWVWIVNGGISYITATGIRSLFK